MITNRTTVIFNYIKQKKEVTFQELCDLFPDYAPITIRRDLTQLEENGSITKVRGGARLNEETVPDQFSYQKRRYIYQKEKSYIAIKALPFVKPNSSIYFDSGTTVFELSHLLPDALYFITTNDPFTAVDLQRLPSAQINLTGGLLTPSTSILTGPMTLKTLEQINIDVAFLSTDGATARHGATSLLCNDSIVKKQVLSLARKKILLMDDRKVGKIYPYTFAPLSEFDCIITNKPLPQDMQQTAREGKTAVIC